MRTPFRDSERIAVQDAAEQRNLQNTELLSNCGSKIEFGMLEMPENLDAMKDGNRTETTRDIRILDDKGNEVGEDSLLSPNKTFVLNGIEYQTDDNGDIYSIDERLQPNTTYELNGNIYTTDENRRIITCEAKPTRSPENPRDNEAQRRAGGEDRRPNDQGGHIIGRDMNGDGGIGNLVAMDSKINQSDYKRMEYDIKNALDEKKDVTVKAEMTYSGDSERPDKITVTVTIDGKDTVYEFDNNLEGLLDDIVSEKSPSAKALMDEHPNAHVSSVKHEYDENENLIKTTAYITWTDDDGNNRRTPIIAPGN